MDHHGHIYEQLLALEDRVAKLEAKRAPTAPKAPKPEPEKAK